MAVNPKTLEKLKELLLWKKSKSYYADKLGVTRAELDRLLKVLKDQKKTKKVSNQALAETEDFYFEEDVEGQTATVKFKSSEEIRTLDELIDKCKIDTKVWKITKYIQNYWGNCSNPHWQVKAFLSPITDEIDFQGKFLDFLSKFKPKSTTIQAPKRRKSPSACFLFDKQDSHLNKYDVDGKNDINERFDIIEKTLENQVSKATLSYNLDKIIYVVGSDQFNSEWMGTTVKGTPQTNIYSYQESFELICQHEIKVIDYLLSQGAELEIIYIPGNHDEYVGWHMVSWLKAYYGKQKNLKFDIKPDYTKCIRYTNTAIMFNHGDELKPKELAGRFPILFKSEWSFCDNYYVFTGDKHNEQSGDINGIKFYQIPALSQAKSGWDKKKVHEVTPAEFQSFVIEANGGLTDTYKTILK